MRGLIRGSLEHGGKITARIKAPYFRLRKENTDRDRKSE